MVAVIDTSALLDSVDSTHPEWGVALESIHAEHDLVSPSLLNWEAGNVIFGKRGSKFGSSHEARVSTLEHLLEGIRLHEPDPDTRERVAAIANKLGLSYYDAAFLEMAARDDLSILVTQDQQLLKAARRMLGATRALDLDGVNSAAAGPPR